MATMATILVWLKNAPMGFFFSLLTATAFVTLVTQCAVLRSGNLLQFKPVSTRLPRTFAHSETVECSQIEGNSKRPKRSKGGYVRKMLSPGGPIWENYQNESVYVRFSPQHHLNNTWNLTGSPIHVTVPIRNPTSDFDGNMTSHQFNPGAYFKLKSANVYVMSAIGRYNVSDVSSKYLRKQLKHIVLTAWISRQHLAEELRCCLLLRNKVLMSYVNPKRLYWYKTSVQPLMASKVYCPIPEESREYGNPVAAGLSTLRNNCHEKLFTRVVYPFKRKRHSLAICSKIVYGALPARRLIEWIEMQKYLGVDKVLFYFYKLKAETMKVLKHYAKQRYVDLLPFDLPQPNDPFRYVGQKKAQSFIDEQVTVYDCVERLQGYSYIGVMDVDEVLFYQTDGKLNLKNMMDALRVTYPMAAGFSFMTEVFVTEWANYTNANQSEFWHTNFRSRTRPIHDRTKSILVTERVIPASVWTHNFTSLPGYTKVKVPSDVATVKHFRGYRANWVKEKSCFIRQQFKDNTISDLIHNIRHNILTSQSIIFNRTSSLASANITTPALTSIVASNVSLASVEKQKATLTTIENKSAAG